MADPSLHCIVIQLPIITLSSTDIVQPNITTNSTNQLITMEYRQRQYNPTYGNRTYSKTFSDHITSTVVNALSDIDENKTYFEGWVKLSDLSHIEDWITQR